VDIQPAVDDKLRLASAGSDTHVLVKDHFEKVISDQKLMVSFNDN
jgi:chromatin assembly factor 1 subunit B